VASDRPEGNLTISGVPVRSKARKSCKRFHQRHGHPKARKAISGLSQAPATPQLPFSEFNRAADCRLDVGRSGGSGPTGRQLLLAAQCRYCARDGSTSLRRHRASRDGIRASRGAGSRKIWRGVWWPPTQTPPQLEPPGRPYRRLVSGISARRITIGRSPGTGNRGNAGEYRDLDMVRVFEVAGAAATRNINEY